MSESGTIEATGPDIEAAITKGVTELGVTRADVIVEIVDEPSRGLLGIGAKQANVRLTVIRAPATPAVAAAGATNASAKPLSAEKPVEHSAERPVERSAPVRSRSGQMDVEGDEWDEELRLEE